jgi:hypothetical protein
MGKSQYWGKGATNLDSVAARFQNSPIIFRTALKSNLKAFSADQHGNTLLEYVDYLLLAGPSREDYIKGTHLIYSLLW